MMREFFVRYDCKYRRRTGGSSRNFQEVDGGKGTVSDVAELCGIALKRVCTSAQRGCFRLLLRPSALSAVDVAPLRPLRLDGRKNLTILIPVDTLWPTAKPDASHTTGVPPNFFRICTSSSPAIA